MASKWPAVKNSAYIFRCVLFAQSDNQIKSNPSLSSGDWKVSIDGGAFANLATLPDVDPDSSVQVKVSLSADEMNGDEIMVTAIDAAGAEWHSAAFVIHTAGQTFDAMEALIDDLESRLTAARAGYLDNLSGGAAALEATAQSILTDTGTTLPGQIAGLNNLSAAQVNAEVDAALADYDAPTKVELDAALASADDAVLAAIAALNNLSSGGAQAAAAAALAAYNAATENDVTGLSIPTATQIADAILIRGFANVENAAELGSLAELLMGAFESAVAGTTWTIRKSGGTTFNTRTVATDPAAEPITSVT